MTEHEFIMTAFYVFLCGLFFGLMQFSYFFALESNMSSARLTYLTTSCAWLLGILGGLDLSKKKRPTESEITLISLLLYYVLLTMVYNNRYDNRLLPLYVILIAGSAVYGGYFFSANQRRFSQVKHLFFWENNGFMAGILGSFLGVTLIGEPFLLYWPLALGCPILLLQFLILREC